MMGDEAAIIKGVKAGCNDRRKMSPQSVVGLIGGIFGIILAVAAVLGIARGTEARMVNAESDIRNEKESTRAAIKALEDKQNIKFEIQGELLREMRADIKSILRRTP